jgi:hypothetical protein
MALSVFVTLAQKRGISNFITSVLTLLECVILVVDSFLFLTYLVSHSWALIKEMVK